jgi:alpha-L-rhamnosidase
MISKVNQEGLKSLFYHYGDWVPPPPSIKADPSFTASWFFLLNLGQVAEMALAIGEQDDAQRYQQLYQGYISQFNSAFYNAGSHSYDNGVQTTYLLPLYSDFVPRGDLINVTSNLLNDIVTVHNTHLTTGILGTKYLSPSLSKLGRTDIALDLALTTTYPSWGYMIYQTLEVSATTLWEVWDSPSEGPGMNSR